MIGINLTTFQKLEVAFICVIFGIAGVFFFINTRPTFDQAINVYKLPTRVHPKTDNASRTAPVTANNPRDPVKDEEVTVFACSDGQLEITNYPNDAKRPMVFFWKPEKRIAGLKYQYYLDPMTYVYNIKDPFRHALGDATFNYVIYGRSLGGGMLGKIGLSDDQIAKQNIALDKAKNSITLVKSDMEKGTFHPELMANVTSAMATYNAKSGDPRTDSAKAALAHKVLAAVKVFQERMELEKNQALDGYMDEMEKILSAEQKQKLIDAYKAYQATTQTAPRVTGRRGTTITPLNPTTPITPRGGAGANTAPRGGAGASTAPRGGAAATRAGATTRG